MKAPLTNPKASSTAGFSIIELMIVVAIISVVTGFAFMQVARARQLMTRENAARQFAEYLEKARVDSVRRRPATAAEMAQVSLIDATFYSVTIDANGDGTLDAPRVMSLPAEAPLQFVVPYPRTIYFNWRGRTVDAAGNVADPAFVSISSPHYGATQINLSSAGQSSLDGPPPSSAVVNSAAPAPTFREKTTVP